MAEQGAKTATMATKNLLKSLSDRVHTPSPSSFTALNVSRKLGGGGGSGCCVKSCCSKRVLSQNNENFERSAVPAKVMYYRNKLWMNFSADVVQTLRTGFLERKPIIRASIDGANYDFDLMRMVQTDCSTGHCRSISWIDENGKCFFPISFFSQEEFTEESGDDIGCNYNNKNNNNNNCNPKIEIEVKIDRASSKRKLEEEPEVSSTYKAVGQDVIKHQRLEEGGAAKWSNMKLLRETERAYLFVRDHFLNGIKRVDDGLKVTSIHQCKHEGPLDKARLQVFQKQIEITKAARGTSSSVYAWYGASVKVVESVLTHGFGLPSKVPATDVHGIGIYLSPVGLPHLSAKLADADDNGVKHLIMCRVILGNVEKVEAGSRQYHPSSPDFDTGSDDPMSPKWYVVWPTHANMHILPEFVVSFRPSGNMQGQPMPVVGAKYSLEKLFSKIRSSLPPAKFQEMLKSYGTFKAGMIAKDTFLSQLQMVAGNEVLRSAIREIYASG
ncbi:hypothetical protein REPUB_Repub19eG0063700 [Reevesia pubescens]